MRCAYFFIFFSKTLIRDPIRSDSTFEMLMQLFANQTLFDDIVQLALLLHRSCNSFPGLTGPAEKIHAPRPFDRSSGVLVEDPSAKSLPTPDFPGGIINRLFADHERQGAEGMESGIGRY